MTDDEKTTAQEDICRRLIEGESLRAICAGEDMPCRMTVCRWLAADEAFRAMYAHAREAQADTLADEILDIADDRSNDYTTKTRPDGSEYEAFDAENVQRSKLRVNSRMWLAAKLQPKKYGEASLVKLADNEGNRLTEMDDTERATRLAAICASISTRSVKALEND